MTRANSEDERGWGTTEAFTCAVIGFLMLWPLTAVGIDGSRGYFLLLYAPAVVFGLLSVLFSVRRIRLRGKRNVHPVAAWLALMLGLGELVAALIVGTSVNW